MYINRITPIVLASLILILGMAGCKTFSTPTGVLEIALEALQKNNLEHFRTTLTGVALHEYGSDQGMEHLRLRLSSYLRFATANQQKLSSKKTGPNSWLDTYSVDVLGTSTESEEPHVLVGSVTTLCSGKTVKTHGPKGKIETKRKISCRISEFRN